MPGVTGAAGASVDVHVSYVDNASGTITPGRANVVNITTATTTDIVAAPGSGAQRNVKAIYVTNTHATASTQATVVHTDGTNVSDLMGVTLLPGENLVLDEDGSWHHHDSQGAEYNYAGPPVSNPVGAVSPNSIFGLAIPAACFNKEAAGHHVLAKDIKLPAGVKLDLPADELVASVVETAAGHAEELAAGAAE